MELIDDIVIPVFLNMGASYLYEKLKRPVLDVAYERALRRWSVNNSIREEMAKHQLAHLTQLSEYIISPETEKNQEIAKLLTLWEEELRKDEKAYQYIHEILEKETLAVVRKNQSMLERVGEIIQELKDGQTGLIDEVRALKNSPVTDPAEEISFTEVERYIGRTVYSPVVTDKGMTPNWLYTPQFLQLPLAHFLTANIKGLGNTNKFILYSSAQSGKTTELKHLAWELNNSGFYQVYFYEIKDYSSRTTLISFLQYTKVEGKVTVLLVDGLDEIKESDRLYLLKELETFAKRHPSLKMLLSCRRNFQQNVALESFLPLYLNDLNWEQVCEYIRCYASRSSALIHEIERLELYQFTTIPFYLNTIISYYEERQCLPRRKGELYQYWIHKSCEVENSKLIDETMQENTEGVLLLRKIAVLMQMTEKTSFSEKEMLEIFRNDRQKIFMCQRFAIFKKDIDRNYSFEHNAFREYLVACFLMETELEEIKRLVCYTGESKVKPLWYNTIVLFLAQLSVKDDLFSEVIDWLSRNDREMLLYVDPEWVGEELRNRIFREIVLYYKGLGIPYSDGSNDFEILMNFGYSVESVRFLMDEIKMENYSDDYLNNLLSLLQYVNYEDLEIRKPELLKELEEILFGLIGKFREEECAYYLYIPLQHKWFCNSGHIRRLYEVIKDSQDFTAIGMFIELLLKTGDVDEYIPYILEKEKYVSNYSNGGVSYRVPRSGIYNAFGRIRTYESLRAILKFIPHDHWGEEEEKLAMKRVLLSIAGDLCSVQREVCDDVIQAFLEECVRSEDFGEPYKRDSFFVYRDFFRQLPFRQNYLEFYTESLKRTFLCETGKGEEREELAYVLALFIDERQIDLIFEGFDPDSENDYCFSSWLRTTFDEKLEKYVDGKIRRYFPKFERTLPDNNAREQRDFDVLCDYELFRNEVLGLIREKAPGCWRDLHPAYRGTDEEKVNLYVIRFFSLYSKDKKYDLLRVEESINSQEKYEVFLFEKVAEKLRQCDFPVVFSTLQERLLAELALKYIDDLLRSRELNHLYRAALDYILIKEIVLPEEKLLNLLPFAAYKVSINGTGYNRGHCLFDYISRQVKECRFQETILNLLNSAELPDEKLIYKMADYITSNCIHGGYHLLVKELVRCQDINHQAQLILYLLKVEGGKERIKRVYKLLPERTQVFFLQKIAKNEEEAEWIKSVLLPIYKMYEEGNRLSALRILLYWGDPDALDYCADWLKKDPYLFGHDGVPAFRYKDIAALDRLTEMLELTLSVKKAHDRLYAGLLYSMQQIAVQSKSNLNKVIEKLRGLIKLNSEYQYLNYYIREFIEKYYEANNSVMTLKEALVKYGTE